MYYLLGLGYNANKKPSKAIICDDPWTHNETIKIFDIVSYKFKNIAIYNGFSIIGTTGDISKYTSFNTETNRILNKALTLLDIDTKNNRYYMADGLFNPSWFSIDDIMYMIKGQGYGLSNCNIQNNKIIPI